MSEKLNYIHYMLLVTNNCTFRCNYCIQEQHKDYHAERLIRRYEFEDLIKFIEKSFDIAETVIISLWGGEPTLDTNYIIKLVDYFNKPEYYNKIRFWMSTNGYRINKILNYINQPKIKNNILSNGIPYFIIQISYDGEPLNTLNRKSLDGNPNCSDEVRKTIQFLKDNDIYFIINSIITIDKAEYIYESYCDVTNNIKPEGFHMALDNRDDNFELDEYIDSKLPILAEQLQKVAEKEKEYVLSVYKDDNIPENPFKYDIFNNKYICNDDMPHFAIGLDGCVYDSAKSLCSKEKNLHIIGNITNLNLVYTLQNKRNILNNSLYYISKECLNCDTTYCIMCHFTSYMASKKKNYLERWFDFAAMKQKCRIYKYISDNVTKPLRKSLNI